MATQTVRSITVQPGDNLCLLAFRAYGDATNYRPLLMANPELDIWFPEPGMTLVVPDA